MWALVGEHQQPACSAGMCGERGMIVSTSPASPCCHISLYFAPLPPHSPASHWPHCRQDRPSLPHTRALPLQQQRLSATTLGAGLTFQPLASLPPGPPRSPPHSGPPSAAAASLRRRPQGRPPGRAGTCGWRSAASRKCKQRKVVMVVMGGLRPRPHFSLEELVHSANYNARIAVWASRSALGESTQPPLAVTWAATPHLVPRRLL